MNLEFCRYIWIFVVTLEFRPYANKGHYLPTAYGEELRVSDPKLRNFRLAWLKRILLFSSFRRCRHYETNQPKHGLFFIVPTKYVILPTRYYWLIEKNYMFSTQEYQNFGSLAPLARIHLWVFSSFWFCGRNNSSWTRTYHECYEHKDIYQQNNKKNRMFQTQKYKIFFSLAIIYSIFLSFCCFCTDKNMLFTNITMRRIACFLRESTKNSARSQ